MPRASSTSGSARQTTVKSNLCQPLMKYSAQPYAQSLVVASKTKVHVQKMLNRWSHMASDGPTWLGLGLGLGLGWGLGLGVGLGLGPGCG